MRGVQVAVLPSSGTGFLTVNDANDWLVPRAANWYAGADRWQSIYGPPLRLAADARRFDTSPAWLSWAGAAPTLELLADIGVDAIHRHTVALANEFRALLDLPLSNSAIVSIDCPGAHDALSTRGIKVASHAARPGSRSTCTTTPTTPRPPLSLSPLQTMCASQVTFPPESTTRSDSTFAPGARPLQRQPVLVGARLPRVST